MDMRAFVYAAHTNVYKMAANPFGKRNNFFPSSVASVSPRLRSIFAVEIIACRVCCCGGRSCHVARYGYQAVAPLKSDSRVRGPRVSTRNNNNNKRSPLSISRVRLLCTYTFVRVFDKLYVLQKRPCCSPQAWHTAPRRPRLSLRF